MRSYNDSNIPVKDDSGKNDDNLLNNNTKDKNINNTGKDTKHHNHKTDLDDQEKDILILELQDDLFRSEKDKNELYIRLNKKITDQELKISELKGKIQKEIGIYDECKNAFDDSIRKMSVSNPTNADFLKMRKENEKINSENKRLSFDLDNAQKIANEYRLKIAEQEKTIKELSDMNSSLKIDEK